jgi:hypothetical protein
MQYVQRSEWIVEPNVDCTWSASRVDDLWLNSLDTTLSDTQHTTAHGEIGLVKFPLVGTMHRALWIPQFQHRTPQIAYTTLRRCTVYWKLEKFNDL